MAFARSTVRLCAPLCSPSERLITLSVPTLPPHDSKASREERSQGRLQGRPPGRLRDISVSAVVMGLVMALVGFSSSFALVLAGLRESGASEAQAATGLMATLLAVGASGIWLAWVRRQPISVAWSLPGAALLITSGASIDGFDKAIGAFLAAGAMLLAAGAFRPLGRAIEAIPSSLANAMLAGILLSLCLAPIKALAVDAWLAAPLLATWWLVGRLHRFAAVPAALLVLVALVVWRVGLPADFGARFTAALRPNPIPVMPVFDPATIIGIGFPLFVVTMASQNIPGIAILRAHGYDARTGPLITNTAGFTLVSAPFGAIPVNLAAVTAAMGASADSHVDPQRRYWASIIAGAGYVCLGLLAGVVVLFVTLIPPIMIEAIAGLALLGSFTGAAMAAFSNPAEREAAAVTFLFAASGLAFLGVGAAFWGLIAGGAMLGLTRLGKRQPRA